MYLLLRIFSVEFPFIHSSLLVLINGFILVSFILESKVTDISIDIYITHHDIVCQRYASLPMLVLGTEDLTNL